MPSRILYVPFVIVALVMLYLTWEVDESFSVYIVPPVLVMALIYIFSPQINWWWYRRRPPELDERLRRLLLDHHRFYRELALEEKQRFRDRIALYMHTQDFMPQGMESVPEDVKLAVAAAAVRVTFGQEDFLLEPFEKIIIYPRPFPSPQFPEKFHASEVFEEDGVLLFSAEQLMRGFLDPIHFYDIGLHEFARVFRHLHPEAAWPELPEDIWDKMETVSRMSRENICKWINLPPEGIPARAVSIAHYFSFPERFREVLPGLFKAYGDIFGV